jgi:nucleobase:cation symporter-1, NCS1 family
VALVDYYVIRRTELKAADLYRRGGEYEYSGGWNLRALMALALGVLPCLPGYLAVSGVVDKAAVAPWMISLFNFGWFFSLAVAGTVYYLSMPRRVAAQGVPA